MTLLLCLFPLLVPLAGAASPEPARAVPFPSRAAAAPTGSAFAAEVESLPDPDRYAATRDALLAGNVPDFLRALVPVVLPGEPAVTVFVSPDYLAVGDSRDYLTVPLDLPGAVAVTRALGCALPTRRIVDAVYRAAALHLAPAPLPAGPDMRSVAYLLRHRAVVGAQRPDDAAAFVAGTQKDLVITPRLAAMPGREAIYGWHRLDGTPIQPLSLVHGVGYADYSHGVRLVADTVLVDGAPRGYFDALADPVTAAVLSDEGPIPAAARLLEVAAGG